MSRSTASGKKKQKKTLGEKFTVVEKRFQTPTFMFDVLY